MKRIVLSRSANVGNLPHKLPTHRCKLTTEGHRQAGLVKRKIAHTLGFNWGPQIIFQSDSCSSEQTSTGIYGSGGFPEQMKRRVLPSLFSDPNPRNQEMLSCMFDDLGCVSLEKYFDTYGRVGERGYTIMSLAQRSCAEIREARRTETDIAIVGHPILLPAVAYFLTSDTYWLYQSLKECETIVLDMNTREKSRICPE